MSTASDLFEGEEAALRAAQAAHACDGKDAVFYRDALGALAGHYRRLLRDTRRIIMHSDRQERELSALNVKLRELAAELDYKASHDALTGALNRRAVIERTEAYLLAGPLTLIILDIDHFKHINDEHGHPAGDATIVELVGRLRAEVPTDAEIGRVGGEEFTVVIPGMELTAATGLAERLCHAVAAIPFAIFEGGRTVTASFGVSYTSQLGNFSDAYSRADAALYRAKHGGRNRVICAD